MPALVYKTSGLKAPVDLAGPPPPLETTRLSATFPVNPESPKKRGVLREFLFTWILLFAGVCLSLYLPWWAARFVAR